jgi:hypothetical protein
MQKTDFIIIITLIGICFVPVFSGAESDQIPNTSGTSSYMYSIVHLSDTQNLATKYPDTYNYTFAYLDSIKARYNISTIIITGDLVNTYNSRKEWEVYANAINKTSIPIYVTAGNHDTNFGKDDRFYSAYTGNSDRYYITSLKNFNLVAIPYVQKTLPSQDFKDITSALQNSTNPLTIIATHFYMDKDGKLSRLGKDINQKLIQKPTIIMAGHKSAHFLQTDDKASYPVVEEITNFQRGNNGPTADDYSAGTLYTITADGENVTWITARTISIYPEQKLDPELVIYPQVTTAYQDEKINFPT